MKLSKTNLMITSILSGVMAIGATPAMAQDNTDEIIVTGSRIKKENLVSSSPVTSVSGDQFEVRGTVNVEDLLNELPQVFAGQGANIGNGASGTATVDLRGLGSSRTLVLIDGKRMGPGSPNAIAPDLNQIPSSLIKNVDILTGGAGAVYGSDALAGVVNFQMDRDLNGVRVDLNMGGFQHNNDDKEIQALLERSGNLNNRAQGTTFDGISMDATIAFGTDFAEGKGNIVGYLGYKEVDELVQADRDYSACAFGGGDSAGTADPGVRCVGSFTTPLGTFTDPTFSQYFFTLDNSDNVPNSIRPLDFGNDTFNFNPTNHFQRPDERFTAGMFAEYELTDRDTLYSDVMFMDDRSTAQIAFSGNFGVTSEVSCDNPFLGPDQLDTICNIDNFAGAPVPAVMDDPATPEDETAAAVPATPGYLTAVNRFNTLNVAPFLLLRRNVEGDPRQDDLRHTAFRGVLGMRGDFRLIDGWEYDIYGSHSQTHFAENYNNEIHVTRAQNALYATTGPGGQPICRPDLVNDASCVPIDWFSIGGVTDAALGYVQGKGFQDGNVEQSIVQGVLTGNVDSVQSPFADTPVSMAVGGEYRLDQYELRTDDNFSLGLLAGQGGPSIGLEGEFASYEAFGEVEIPLAEGRPGMNELTFNGAYRYSDNSLSGGSDSYSAGLIWEPVEAVRLRGQYQRAVRAANAIELFRATSIGLFNGSDPCAGATPAFTLQQCANSGVTAAQYGNIIANPAGQYNQLLGGNTELNPEKSDTFTIGAVLRPTGALEGLTLSVDYFDIEVNGFISTVPPQDAVNGCVQENDPVLCDLVNRDPASGSLWLNSNGFVTATNVNTGSLDTSGIDVNADYTVGLGDKGDLSFNVAGTYLLDLGQKSLPTSDRDECAGLYGDLCGIPNPEWRHIASATWEAPFDLSAQMTWRHFSKVNIDPITGNDGAGTDAGAFDETLKAQNYFDLAFTYRGIEDVTLRTGVNNMFDKAPPLSSAVGAGFGNGNTYPQVYDALGRYLFARATIDF